MIPTDLFDDNKYLKLKAAELVKILKEADKAYHDKGEIKLTDINYDILKDRLKEIAPKNAYFKKVGYQPPAKLKVKLPYYLGSQDKIKYEDYEKNELSKWISKYNKPSEYIISEKLDGISCLIVNDDDIKIYTRGDGYYGMDITYIKDYIKSIPDKIPKGIAIRGELLLSKKNWDKIKDIGVNARNVVAGIINSKTLDIKVLSLIDFIVYDILNDRINNYDALNKIAKKGFKVVKHVLLKEPLTNDKLFEYLKNFKLTSEYEIDGIVITHNKSYDLKEGENPKYSFAFKSNLLLDEAEVVVIDVIWNISKDKYLKPIVKFNPIFIEGVSIKQATGFNADFIVKNKIGKGAIIKIQRSGGVIPDIKEVLKPADNNKPLMPDIPYKWNKTNIDIIAEINDKNREHDIKSFTYFMKSLNIKGVSDGIITKLYDNGYDTILKIINRWF
jgi:DNA ligase (NAD+)